jgi:transposase-like protein
MKKSNKVVLAHDQGSSPPSVVVPLPAGRLSSDHEPPATSPDSRPGTEVVERATRRRFTGEYKLRILREAAEASARGELGALLRREGLYSSHLTTWRAEAERGQLAGLKPKRRGPKATAADPRDKRIAELEREVARLGRRAERAEALVEVQKKLSELLGIALPTAEETK